MGWLGLGPVGAAEALVVEFTPSDDIAPLGDGAGGGVAA